MFRNSNLNIHPAKLGHLDDSPDFRQERASVLAWIADRRVEAAPDVEQRIDQFLLPDDDTFVKTLVNVNRVLTKTSSDSFNTEFMIPYTNIILDENMPGYVQVLPHHEDKKSLLYCLREVGLDMRALGRSPEHIAAVIGHGINLVHPFAQANGRTARMVHDALVYGTNSPEDRFAFLAEDTLDNTVSLNPAMIENYVYRHMQYSYDTHKLLEGGTSVPRVRFAMSPPTAQNISARMSDMAGNISSPFDSTFAAIMHPEISPMLAYFMAKGQDIPAANGAVMTRDEKEYLNMDIFSQRANDDDWDAVHKLARQITATYAIDAMHILAAHPSYGEELSVTINTREHGLEKLPISRLISQLAQQKIHFADSE